MAFIAAPWPRAGSSSTFRGRVRGGLACSGPMRRIRAKRARLRHRTHEGPVEPVSNRPDISEHRCENGRDAVDSMDGRSVGIAGIAIPAATWTRNSLNRGNQRCRRDQDSRDERRDPGSFEAPSPCVPFLHRRPDSHPLHRTPIARRGAAAAPATRAPTASLRQLTQVAPGRGNREIAPDVFLHSSPFIRAEPGDWLDGQGKRPGDGQATRRHEPGVRVG